MRRRLRGIVSFVVGTAVYEKSGAWLGEAEYLIPRGGGEWTAQQAVQERCVAAKQDRTKQVEVQPRKTGGTAMWMGRGTS